MPVFSWPWAISSWPNARRHMRRSRNSVRGQPCPRPLSRPERIDSSPHTDPPSCSRPIAASVKDSGQTPPPPNVRDSPIHRNRSDTRRPARTPHTTSATEIPCEDNRSFLPRRDRMSAEARPGPGPHPPASSDGAPTSFPEHRASARTKPEADETDLTDSDFLPIFTPHYRTKTRFP